MTTFDEVIASDDAVECFWYIVKHKDYITEEQKDLLVDVVIQHDIPRFWYECAKNCSPTKEQRYRLIERIVNHNCITDEHGGYYGNLMNFESDNEMKNQVFEIVVKSNNERSCYLCLKNCSLTAAQKDRLFEIIVNSHNVRVYRICLSFKGLRKKHKAILSMLL